MIFIGCDPGKTGALVALSSDGELLSVVAPMPVTPAARGSLTRVDGRALIRWFEAEILKHAGVAHNVTLAIEKVGTMPSDGAKAAWGFGAATQAIHSMADFYLWRRIEVPPKDWQAAFLRGRPKKGREEIKASAAAAAVDLFPELSEKLAVKKNWGAADAALLAEYARIARTVNL